MSNMHLCRYSLISPISFRYFFFILLNTFSSYWLLFLAVVQVGSWSVSQLIFSQTLITLCQIELQYTGSTTLLRIKFSGRFQQSQASFCWFSNISCTFSSLVSGDPIPSKELLTLVALNQCSKISIRACFFSVSLAQWTNFSCSQSREIKFRNHHSGNEPTSY